MFDLLPPRSSASGKVESERRFGLSHFDPLMWASQLSDKY